MALIKDDGAVKVFATPLNQLVEAGSETPTVGRRLANEGGVRAKDDTPLDILILRRVNLVAVLELVQLVDFNFPACSNVEQVTLCVVLEVRADAEPERPFASSEVVLIDDTGYSAALAHTGAVANEETGSTAVGEKVLMLLTGVDDRFKLEG